jgi:2-polyprenyl-3-methyl-5-hydroxy-6-metoxy-1,4-benzoquinol methylase
MTESDSDGFFNSYGMDVQTLMLRDASRLDAYAAAIEANRDFIRGRIVLDVGAGTGALHLTSLETGDSTETALQASYRFLLLERGQRASLLWKRAL